MTQLQQLENRIAELQTLQHHVAEQCGDKLSFYTALLQEYTDAVLLYQKVARHWPALDKACAKQLIDACLAKHSQLIADLQERHQLLGEQIDKVMRTPAKRRLSKTYQTNSRILNLQG